MLKQINTLKPHVLICLTIIFATLVCGASLVFIKTSGFSFENGNTKIKVEGAIAKEIINNDDYSNKQLRERVFALERAIAENNNTPKEVIKAVEQLKPTAQATIDNSEKLQEIISDSIENRSE